MKIVMVIESISLCSFCDSAATVFSTSMEF